MTGMNRQFPDFFYVVVPREVRDRNGAPYDEWLIRKGGSDHTIKKFERKQEAVDDAQARVLGNRHMAGVIVSNTQRGVHRVWTDDQSPVFRVALDESMG